MTTPAHLLPLQTLQRRPLAAVGLVRLLLFVAPRVWSSGLGQTLLSQVGIGIIACLAYNVLLGQGGMLSFGHAVYSGMGAFLAIHTLNQVGAGQLGCRSAWCPWWAAWRAWPARRCWVCVHQEVRGTLRHDHAGPGRADVVDVADAARSSLAARAASRPTAWSARQCWASTSARRSSSTT